MVWIERLFNIFIFDEVYDLITHKQIQTITIHNCKSNALNYQSF